MVRLVTWIAVLAFAADAMAAGWATGSRQWLNRLTRETNSRAATAQGIRAFARGDFEAAARKFAAASRIAPGPRSEFNLGTAKIAGQNPADGASSITKAMEDPALRPVALFNRGTGALRANAYDHAIRDLTDVLKLRPGDRAAKRNLEIALEKKEQERKENEKSPQGGGSEDQRPGSTPRNEQGKGGAEEILRSVQQQEREELTRMRKPRRQPERIGW